MFPVSIQIDRIAGLTSRRAISVPQTAARPHPYIPHALAPATYGKTPHEGARGRSV